MSQGYRYIPGICWSQGFVAVICPRIIWRDVFQGYVPVCFLGICPRDMLPEYRYIPGICWSQDLLQWYVPELFEGMCPKDMSQGYVVKICPWDMLQGYVPEICSSDTFQGQQFQGSHNLDKSLKFRGSPWKVLKFLCKSLKGPWIFFNIECSGLESVFDVFWLSKTVYKS